MDGAGCCARTESAGDSKHKLPAHSNFLVQKVTIYYNVFKEKIAFRSKSGYIIGGAAGTEGPQLTGTGGPRRERWMAGPEGRGKSR
jgi:hypothetical protein